MKLRALFLCLTLLAPTLGLAGPSELDKSLQEFFCRPDQVVATVNGGKITQGEVLGKLQAKLSKFLTELSMDEEEALFQILDARLAGKSGQKAGGLSPSQLKELYAQSKVSIRLPSYRSSIDVGSAPALGPSSAPVTVVEFTDYQCPFCHRMQATLQELRRRYGGQVRWAVKNFPLSFHSNAVAAANAALCANAQGKYWDYAAVLWEHSASLDKASLKNYARDLGLNEKAFKACVDSEKFKGEIEKDMAQAKDLGVAGTPAFFINGIPLTGAQPAEAFSKIIDQELKK